MPAGIRISGNCCAGVYEKLTGRPSAGTSLFASATRASASRTAPGRPSAPCCRAARSPAPRRTSASRARSRAWRLLVSCALPKAFAAASSPPSSSDEQHARRSRARAGSARACRTARHACSQRQEAREQQVRHRHDDQRQQRRGDQPADRRNRDRRAELAAFAACPCADGSMPRIIAIVVIRIGRSRTGPALRMASSTDRPSRDVAGW